MGEECLRDELRTLFLFEHLTDDQLDMLCADGSIETLMACDQTVLDAGDAVILTTPTPGGFGQA